MAVVGYLADKMSWIAEEENTEKWYLEYTD